MDDIIEELAVENERLKKEIILLKNTIESLKIQISEIRSDLIVQKAEKRGRP
tara:strand:+ start:712 stop:867 length:156 start_codon:yes stop_codon:yes gene_type:complete